MAADLEKTRQALLIATVKKFYSFVPCPLFFLCPLLDPLSSGGSNFFSIYKEKGDFSRLPKKMGHAYSMAMIRLDKTRRRNSFVEI